MLQMLRFVYLCKHTGCHVYQIMKKNNERSVEGRKSYAFLLFALYVKGKNKIPFGTKKIPFKPKRLKKMK